MKKNYLPKLVVAMAIAALLPLDSEAQIVSTVAGTGTAAYSGDGAAATAAEISKPAHVITDAAGNLYISDHDNNRVRKISTTGVISTIAGDGTAGFGGDGGPATAAALNRPNGIAFDYSGNLYIADENNNRIRKIDGTGTITTIAGTGSAGYSGDGSAATAATLNHPNGIAIDITDATPSIFIAEGANHVVRYINASGTIGTIAGTHVSGFSGDGGSAMSAKLNFPYDVAIDSGGFHLYIADAGNNRIRILTGLTINTFAGNGTGAFSGDAGAATAASLNYPATVMADAWGNVFISDGANNRIRKVNGAGTITTIVGNGVPGFGGDGSNPLFASLYYPGGTAFDATGNLYIADANNHRIRKVTPMVTTAVANGITPAINDEPSLYPNPATSSFFITVPANTTTVTVTDNLGRVLFTQQISNNQAHTLLLNTSSLPSGNYIVNTKTANKNYRNKLVIVK